ncbi:MAG: amino acid adenylation domain-containing protein, partial [bacterium]
MTTDDTQGLADERQRLLAELMADEGLDDAADAEILPRHLSEARLGYGQELLWLVEQMHPGVALSNIPELFDIRGALDVHALRQALDDMVTRHSALRTAFAERDGVPYQQVQRAAEVPWTMHDLRGEPAAHRAAAAHRIIEDDVRAPFAFGQAPILRATLVRLTEDHSTLLLMQHHLVCDGWSRERFFPELSARYAARRTARAGVLPPPVIEFTDFAEWQRDSAESGALAADVAYWRERLHGAADVLELPTDRPRGAVRGFAGAEESTVFGKDLMDRVWRLAQARGVTPYMTLFAAFQVLLARYSGQNDFIIGTPVSGRTRTEMEDVVGYFANMIPLRTDLVGDPSFAELLDRVRASSLDAFEHQDVPFARLVQELARATSSVHTPLFQAMFSLQSTDLPELPLDGLDTTRLYCHSGWSTFDMWLFVRPMPDGLRVWVEYRTDLFDAATMQRMLGHLQVLLEGAVADPSRPVSRIPILTAAERTQVLDGFNTTAAQFPAAASIHALIEAQVARTPHAVAVEDDNVSLTYAALDARANQLARHLISAGVGNGELVGLAIERSVELMVGLIAVMKTGAAYIPLDPDYPADRLSFMLRDSGARVLVTQERVRGQFAEFDGRLVSLDGDAADIAQSSGAPLAPRATPDDLAYVIYTSGSTGVPKGAMLPHRAVVNYLQWMQSAYVLGATDCVLQKAPVSFDASVWELYLPLIAGARLFLARPDGHRDPDYLLATIAARRVTVVQFVPSLLGVLLEEFAEAGRGVRLLVLGGEALPGELASRLRALFPSLEVQNLYGPTEAAVYATAWTLPIDFVGGVVPIGKPISNDRIYVLAPGTDEPMPIGVPGELCIGGSGVGSGYLHRPELTAEKFVADPFLDGGSGRMYRTGDLARWRSDGVIEFLGRIDHQVKIRGFRVELGEIESALGVLEGVRECVIVQRGESLVGYVVAERGAELDAAALREALRDELPEYMVPSALVVLEAMPLNANGKLDRKALPDPGTIEGSRAYLAPRTALEAQIAEVWATVLGRTRVGVEDDFFEVGGHSLLGMRILARLASQLGRRLSLRQLFDGRTVAGLAAQLAVPVTEAAPVAGIPRLAGAEAPTAFAQELLWLVEQMTTGPSGYGGPEVLRVRGSLDEGAFAAALTDVVTHQDALRTEFFAVDGVPRQRVLADVQVPVTVVDLRDHATPAAAALARLETEVGRPVDLGAAPLYRAMVVRVEEEAWLVGLFTHHIVTDDLSRGIVFRELATAYAARRAGHAPVFAPLPVRYRDYAAWQRSRVQGAHLEELMAYWRGQLAGVPEVLELATDKPRPPVRSFVGSRRRALWSPELLAGVKALGQGHGATLFMTILAAFEVVLARHSGQEDFVVGSPVSGRTRPEVEEVVGYFANMLALRADLRGTPTFAELLARVRSTCLGAYEHEEVPFEALVRELRHGVQPSHAPIFQTMFAMLNPEPLRPVLAGATVELVEFEIPWARYDLWLVCRETEAGIEAELEYRSDLFEPETIDRFLTHVRTVLEHVVRDARVPIADLSVLADAERAQVVHEFNATDTVYPAVASIQALI